MKIVRGAEKPEEQRNGYTRRTLLEHNFETEECGSTWVGLVTIPPSKVAQTHFHENVTEMFYFLGSGTLGVNDDTYKVNKGDLVIVEPKDTHWVKAGENPLKIIVFKFPNVPEDKTLVE